MSQLTDETRAAKAEVTHETRADAGNASPGEPGYKELDPEVELETQVSIPYV